jgi:hypothetical protein
MEGFSFVTPITGLNRPDTGMEDDDDSNNHCAPLFYTAIKYRENVFQCNSHVCTHGKTEE